MIIGEIPTCIVHSSVVYMGKCIASEVMSLQSQILSSLAHLTQDLGHMQPSVPPRIISDKQDLFPNPPGEAKR